MAMIMVLTSMTLSRGDCFGSRQGAVLLYAELYGHVRHHGPEEATKQVRPWRGVVERAGVEAATGTGL